MTLTSGTLLPHSHDPWLVALSVLIAVAAAYTALDFAGRVRIRRGRERAAWLFGGAFAMGTGIWSMHFTGMLAFSLPVPVYYDVPTVMASHLAAVAASAAALHVASQQRLGAWAWWTGSVLMGGGIGVMHYTGMLALRLPGTMHHAPAMVALSVVLAVVVALVALRLTFKFRDGATGGSRWRKPVSALVMGLAIPALHYAAMAGASFISGDTLSGDLSHAVGSAQLGGTALIVGTVVVLGLALLAAYADRRITAARQEKEQGMRHSEARLRAILEAALDCIITIDQEGRIVELNPAAERTFGYRRAEVIGKEMAALMVPPALREGHRRSLATGEGPLLDGRREIRLLWADGTEIPAEIAVTRIGVEGPPLFTAYLRDITDQKAARQALEATGARLQHLLVCSPTVIYSTAATGDYACSFISENLLELIGYQAAELVNDKDFWLERVHPDDKTRVLAEFEDTVPRERGAFEYRFRHKDGRYRWIQDSYRLTRGTKGHPSRSSAPGSTSPPARRPRRSATDFSACHWICSASRVRTAISSASTPPSARRSAGVTRNSSPGPPSTSFIPRTWRPRFSRWRGSRPASRRCSSRTATDARMAGGAGWRGKPWPIRTACSTPPRATSQGSAKPTGSSSRPRRTPSRPIAPSRLS